MILRLIALLLLLIQSPALATITTSANSVTIAGNNSQTSFGFGFVGVSASDISVIYTNTSGVQTTLTQGPGSTQYQVTLNSAAPGQLWGIGGTITYDPSGSPIPSGSLLTITRTVPNEQTVNLQNQASFGQYASSTEMMGDLLEMQIQQAQTGINYAIQANPSNSVAPSVLPPAAQAAGLGLCFDGSGNDVIACSLAPSGTISSAMAPVVSASTLANGRTAFGLPASGFPTSSSGNWYANNGAVILRFNDRAQVGGATVLDGNSSPSTEDWLSTFEIAAGLSSGATWFAELAVLTQPNSAAAGGAFGILGGAQSLYSTSAGTSTIGSAAYAVNNNTTLATDAWAFYSECHKVNSTVGSCIAEELDARTTVSSVNPWPYQQGDVIGLQIGCGAGLAATDDCSSAIQIVPNPNKFKIGINFMSNALTSNVAIALAQNQLVQWYNSSADQLGFITDISTTAANTTGIQFNDNGTEIQGNNGTSYAIAFFLKESGTPVNYLEFAPTATGSPPSITASGSDMNVSLNLKTTGSGVLEFNGTAGVNCTAGSVSASTVVVSGGLVTAC